MPVTTSTPRSRHRERSRIARIGDLGTLAFSMPPGTYQWYLTQVYDLRFPRIGDNRHADCVVGDSLRGGIRSRHRSKLTLNENNKLVLIKHP